MHFQTCNGITNTKDGFIVEVNRIHGEFLVEYNLVGGMFLWNQNGGTYYGAHAREDICSSI